MWDWLLRMNFHPCGTVLHSTSPSLAAYAGGDTRIPGPHHSTRSDPTTGRRRPAPVPGPLTPDIDLSRSMLSAGASVWASGG